MGQREKINNDREKIMIETWENGRLKELTEMLVEVDKDATTTIVYKRFVCFSTMEVTQSASPSSEPKHARSSSTLVFLKAHEQR